MPTSLGAHSPHAALARELLTKKGRREHGRFSFEGPTLLEEALASGVSIERIFVTADAAARHGVVGRAESEATPVHLVDQKTLGRMSDVETPAGIVAVAPMVLETPEELLDEPGLVALLAGVSDPGNAGTLLRSAEAFGLTRVLFASGSVEPYHPKVVRAAMGSIFRLRLGVITAAELAARPEWQVTGLDARGTPLDALSWPEKAVIAVGSERQGLGPFEPLCGRTAAIPMRGKAESLNASVAGSLAFYEAAKRLK
ncbi:MAG TPA: RNA methyltransferase [Candidatus Baltobacteraceae bacterium]|nr:RNA methyltransferase [Candidatus Baltobacteraceae bacterium]